MPFKTDIFLRFYDFLLGISYSLLFYDIWFEQPVYHPCGLGCNYRNKQKLPGTGCSTCPDWNFPRVTSTSHTWNNGYRIYYTWIHCQGIFVVNLASSFISQLVQPLEGDGVDEEDRYFSQLQVLLEKSTWKSDATSN